MKRIAITGIGILGPWGRDKEIFWDLLKNGQPIFQDISAYSAPINTKLGGEIKEPGSFENDVMLKQANKYCQYSVLAAEDGLKDADLKSLKNSRETAVILGTTVGYPTINQFGDMLSPIKSQYIYYHTPAGMICIRNRIKGLTFTVTSGEVSGAQAVSWGVNLIRWGRAKTVIAGAADILSRTLYYHYYQLNELSTYDEEREDQCLPFDCKRNGIILSEGAAFLVLEELEQARERGAHIYGEIIGIGNHLGYQQPIRELSLDGQGIELSMEEAIHDASLAKAEIDYICAAANGSKVFDKAEATAVINLFPDKKKQPFISSIKAIMGESLSAGTIFNLIKILYSFKNDLLIPTAGLTDPEFDLNYIQNSPRQEKINVALSNSLSYGGNQVTLILKRYEE